MAAIAYITDPKMLEIHRIDRRHRANFWRLSSQNNFRDFQEGDLLFFLSKDRQYQRNGEKGIVGYGRAESFSEASPAVLWKRYGIANGYDSFADFKAAIMKVSKDHQLPKKMSSIYLVDVNYFQTPIYLSDYGMNLSANTESFCYLKKDIVEPILRDNIQNLDSWSQHSESKENVWKEIARYSLFSAQEKIKDFPVSERTKKRFLRKRKKILEKHPEMREVKDSCCLFYQFSSEKLIVYFLKEEKIDIRLYLGQKELLKREYEKIIGNYQIDFLYWEETL